VSSEPPTAGTDATLAAAGARLATALLSRPVRLARHTAGLVGELVRIGLGSSTLAPDPADPRFAAAAWARDPVLRRAVQTHLATTGAADALLADAGLADADDAVLRGLVATLADLASPSSNPVLRALASGRTDAPADIPDVAPGETSVVLAAVPPAARPTAPRRLVVGEEVAATPGAVVLRTPSFELLHYLPQTREVRDVPVLVVPAPTAASYLADLSPRRSLVEYLVRGGQQVLAMSWADPAARAGDAHGAPLDLHGQAVLDALDACERISRTPATALLGVGDGATLAAATLAHLATLGLADRVACAAWVAADGPLPAGAARDLRQWAADGADVPDGLRGALERAAAALDGHGHADLLGTPVDVDAVAAETFVVGDGPGVARWARAAGSGAVHVEKLSHAGPDAVVATPDAGAPDDSWWTALLAWLGPRTGPTREAPAELGGRGLRAVAPSPGDYVLAR